MTKRPAKLLLEDGTLYCGAGFGWQGIKAGEVVFNTSMTGYQEIITDPSYCGQIVVMTYPQIGNYGVNKDDSESFSVWCGGLVVREYSKNYSNCRATSSLDSFMARNRLPGIEGIDTRALVKNIQEKGSMKGVLACGGHTAGELEKFLKKSPGIENLDLVSEINKSGEAAYKNYTGATQSKSPVVAVIDFGVKLSILKKLENAGLSPRPVSGGSSVDDILKISPAGIVISNGPGDPRSIPYGIELVGELIKLNKKERIPVLGICLGIQLIGLAAGGRAYKLKFGHHGANHPVKDLKTGKVDITSQNHNYCIDIKSLPPEYEITHINLNDGTLEGIKLKGSPLLGFQYHPEAGPGPEDSNYIFRQFRELIDARS